MTDEFKPFSQVSRPKLTASLRDINKHGKAAGLALYFIAMADSDGLAPGDYDTLMTVTGLSAATISSHLPRLQSVGLIALADPHPQTAATRYRVSRDWVRFQDADKKVVVPEPPPTSKVVVPETDLSTSKVEVENNVVSDDSNPLNLIGGSQQTAPARDEKLEVPKLPKEALEVPMPSRYADKNAFEVWEAGGGKLTPGIGDRIGNWIDTFGEPYGYDGEEMTKRAIFQTYRQGAINKLAYVDSILRRWVGEPTAKEVRADVRWGINQDVPKPVVAPSLSVVGDDVVALRSVYLKTAPGLAEHLKGASLRGLAQTTASILVKDEFARSYLQDRGLRERIVRELTTIRKARGVSEVTAIEFVIAEDLKPTGTEG